MAETQMERLERIVRDFNKATPWVLSKADMAWLLDRAEIAIRIPYAERTLLTNEDKADEYEAYYAASVSAGRARMIAEGEMAESDFAPSSLEDAIRFTETWMKDALPANECGQVPFGRALLETCVDSMKAELARNNGTTCEDEGCPHYGTPHGHGDAG